LRFFFFKREAGADECANESLKSNTESPEITTKTYSAKRRFSKCERETKRVGVDSYLEEAGGVVATAREQGQRRRRE
jgi:hypothetical protein